MQLRILPENLSVCLLESLDGIDFTCAPVFLGVTQSEISLVCETDKVPFHCRIHEDGWRALTVVGTLDFSLTGVLSGILAVLAEAGIAVFVVSTYQTDTILVKRERLSDAAATLVSKGYEILYTENGNENTACKT